MLSGFGPPQLHQPPPCQNGRAVAGQDHWSRLPEILPGQRLGLGSLFLAMGPAVPTMIEHFANDPDARSKVPAMIGAPGLTKFSFAHRGRGMGIWTAAFFLGQSQSPRVVHLLDVQTGSMQGAFLAAGLVALAAAVVTAILAALRGKAA